MEFKDWLYKQRKKAGLTQGQLGELVGIKKQRIHQYENGTEPGISLVVKIADVLGVSLDSLLPEKEKNYKFIIGRFTKVE